MAIFCVATGGVSGLPGSCFLFLSCVIAHLAIAWQLSFWSHAHYAYDSSFRSCPFPFFLFPSSFVHVSQLAKQASGAYGMHHARLWKNVMRVLTKKTHHTRVL